MLQKVYKVDMLIFLKKSMNEKCESSLNIRYKLPGFDIWVTKEEDLMNKVSNILKKKSTNKSGNRPTNQPIWKSAELLIWEATNQSEKQSTNQSGKSQSGKNKQIWKSIDQPTHLENN
uniref:Uncharacterized protein n=1 Tax=Romanomermis culicivorax TaxID=13658 RepID=A0A915HY05_ROMCU